MADHDPMLLNAAHPLVPDYCEPLMGWRIWRVRHGLLYPWLDATPWPFRRPLEAVHHQILWASGGVRVCRQPPCPPTLLPGCGIYAYKDPDSLLSTSWTDDLKLVAGQVALWGRVHEHERGWRAQFAYPVRLIAATDDDVDMVALAATYGIQHGFDPRKDDPRWKSVFRSERSSSNRWYSQYHVNYQWNQRNQWPQAQFLTTSQSDSP